LNIVGLERELSEIRCHDSPSLLGVGAPRVIVVGNVLRGPDVLALSGIQGLRGLPAATAAIICCAAAYMFPKWNPALAIGRIGS
jgi:hypothetical protein